MDGDSPLQDWVDLAAFDDFTPGHSWLPKLGVGKTRVLVDARTVSDNLVPAGKRCCIVDSNYQRASSCEKKNTRC